MRTSATGRKGRLGNNTVENQRARPGRAEEVRP
jgi:hypothetical protein